MIVVTNKLIDHTPSFFQGKRCFGTDAFFFQGLEVAFFFAIGLWVIRGGSHMIHALLAQKELEVTRSELWTVVGDDSRIYTGVLRLQY